MQFLAVALPTIVGLRTTWFRDPWGTVFILMEKRRRPRSPTSPSTDPRNGGCVTSGGLAVPVGRAVAGTFPHDLGGALAAARCSVNFECRRTLAVPRLFPVRTGVGAGRVRGSRCWVSTENVICSAARSCEPSS